MSNHLVPVSYLLLYYPMLLIADCNHPSQNRGKCIIALR